MSSELNYYKFSIRTNDGARMSNVIEYQGLFLGQIANPDGSQSQKRTRPFALIRYLPDDTQTQTLWRGEITNFNPGYNLEIFPHPESPGDYLIFTHPESNLASNHCYWLQQEGTSIEITAAQTDLTGLKYIHYHAGRFIGVFHWNPIQRIHLGRPHQITIIEITMSFRGKKGQLIRKGNQIGINGTRTASPHDLASFYTAKNRICSVIPPGEDYMVFQLNLSVQVKYNILTHELTATTDVIEFLQPDGTLLDEWDVDMPPNPVYNVLQATLITGTQDFLVQDIWTHLANKLYIYKQSDKRFHRIATPIGWPKYGAGHVHFLNPSRAILTYRDLYTCKYLHSLVELDTESLTLTIIGESKSEHSQSISVLPSGAILLNNCLFEPIRASPLAKDAIARVATAITSTTADKSIPYSVAELIGKFALLKSSSATAVATLND